MTPDFKRVTESKYVLLTTFRKDGTPVATPLWAALDGERLLVWTVTDSYKVKRIRRNPSVTVAVCDARGNPKGDPVAAKAEILDGHGTDHARDAIARRYGIIGWLTMKGSLLRRGKTGTVGIAISET
ncbi:MULTISPECIES: PPOX class F420-dependent oxidoreductase [Rhodococcus]|uniref:PPOX class F420-dependent oxidoreductase n=1 Tax=Rhodococcus TaxID=1827 RepID=UPI0015626D2B|nr:PPOX class F420-dependent oxidoreductase [Rhodococcus globerulus]NRI64711.1 PPOX class F420-dependent oxidoreductase [Rhodococcus sp. MS16]QXW03329.1 PPOX class F420-dependent oxidoreductase [Rhodococcus globerulus]